MVDKQPNLIIRKYFQNTNMFIVSNRKASCKPKDQQPTHLLIPTKFFTWIMSIVKLALYYIIQN